MNEFQFSTLVVAVLLLVGVGGYSYIQIARAKSKIKARQAASAPKAAGRAQNELPPHAQTTVARESVNQQRTQDHQTISAAQNSTPQSVSLNPPPNLLTSFEQPKRVVKVVGYNEPRRAVQDDVAASGSAQIAVKDESMHLDTRANVNSNAHSNAHSNANAITELNTDSNTEKNPQPQITVVPSQTQLDVVAHEPAPELSTIAQDKPSAVVQAPVSRDDMQWIEPTKNSTSETSNSATHAPITSMQDLVERATWAVFAPWMRLDSWFTTAYPQGVEKVNSIDAIIDITIAQPKVTEDIERALADLRLNTQLPLHLVGARAGRVSMDAAGMNQRTREWEPLEVGAPYSALRLSLQLANRTHCVDEALLQAWFDLAEKLRKRLAGQIETLPDTMQLLGYARYLHGMARRLAQPIVLQLHKANGLWPAYEIHQQLTNCGAVLNQSGVYFVREHPTQGMPADTVRAPIYTVMNDMNNPRALDFFRDQMAMMHVHTLSFCLEFARVDGAVEALQRMCTDVSQAAHALDAQWQNSVGDEISEAILLRCVQERAQEFNQTLNTLGLSAGSLMTKRLLAQ